MNFKLIETPKMLAQDLMDLDKKLLDNLDPKGPAYLHLYDWDGPSITYGYFINQNKTLNENGLKKWGIHTGRRPTGGGVTIHLSDLAFSVLVPESHEGYHEKTLDNYLYINQIVKKAIKNFMKSSGLNLLKVDSAGLDLHCQNYCMAKPTIYDVMLEGKKVAGAAQRKKKRGFLHQGTISIAIPKMEILKDILPQENRVLEAMMANSFTFLGVDYSEEELNQARAVLRRCLKEAFLGS